MFIKNTPPCRVILTALILFCLFCFSACREVVIFIPVGDGGKEIVVDFSIPDDLDTGDIIIDQETLDGILLNEGDTITALPDINIISSNNANLAFKGWYTKPDGKPENAVVFPFVVDKNTEIYACFEEKHNLTRDKQEVSNPL